MSIHVGAGILNKWYLGVNKLNKVMLGTLEIFPNLGVITPVFTPADLFLNGEQGFWLDLSDLGTMFQDSAGTIPVTAVEQPVGRILDKSGRGNYMAQATASKRPVLSARKNNVNNSQWDTLFATAGTNSAANTTAPDGTMTAGKLNENSAGGAHTYAWGSNENSTTGLETYSVVAKPAERNCLRLSHSDTVAWASCDFDVLNGTFGNAVGCTGTITPHPLGGGWFVCSLTRTRGGGGGGGLGLNILLDIGVDSYQGVYGNGVTVAWQQSEAGAVPTRYQSITSASVYDTVDFPYYLKNDGIDDCVKGISAVTWDDMFAMFGYAFVAGVEPWGISTETANASGLRKYAGNNTLSAGNGIAASVLSTVSNVPTLEGGTAVAATNNGTARLNGTELGALITGGSGMGAFKAVTMGRTRMKRATFQLPASIKLLYLVGLLLLKKSPAQNHLLQLNQE